MYWISQRASYLSGNITEVCVGSSSTSSGRCNISSLQIQLAEASWVHFTAPSMHRVVWFVSTLQANARIYVFISFLICPLNLVSSQIVHVQYVTYWCISEEMAQLSYLRMYLVVYCLPTFSFVSLMLRAVTSLSILKCYTQFRYGTSILMSTITLCINTDPSQYSYSSLSITHYSTKATRQRFNSCPCFNACASVEI